MPKIIIYIFLFLFLSLPLHSKSLQIVYVPVKSQKSVDFIKGVKKSAHQVNLSSVYNVKPENADIILTFNVADYQKYHSYNKKNFIALIKESDLKGINTQNLTGALISELPVYKIAMEIKEHYKNVEKIGIVLNDENMIKKIAMLRIYSPLIKVYEVSDKAKILLSFNKAIEDNDFIVLLPDKFVFNYFTFQKILKILMAKEISFAGYSKNFMKFGAKICFEINYFEEGKRIGAFLKSIKSKNVNKLKKFYTDNIDFYLNHE